MSTATGHEGHGATPHRRNVTHKPKRAPRTHAKSEPKRSTFVARHGRGFTIAGITLVALSVLLVTVLAIRKHAVNRRAAAATAAEVDRGPNVMFARAEMGPVTHDFTIAAEAHGYYQTTAYAKVSGYVRDVRVDKGDHVKKGQILGTIESPETDQQVRAAQSDVALKKDLYDRAKRLAPDIVSLQDFQTATSNLQVSNASLESALALQSYETIRAPFDGVVTMRYVDPGALMPAATGSTTSAQPFVDVADATRLRVDAYLGQDEAMFVHEGDAVSITQDNDKTLVDATVTREARALDPRTRTMLIEMEIDNGKGLLVPGAFSRVTFHIHTTPAPWIPAEAVLLRDGKTLVAVIAQNHVHFTPVSTGVTDGVKVQILSGLSGGEEVALDLPAETGDGAAVRAKERPPAKEGASVGDAGSR